MAKPTSPLAHDEYLSRSYMPELDGIRALSVVMVVCVHLHAFQESIWQWTAGGRGVTLFFVLSGYLITMLAMKEEMQRGRIALGAFYIRRAFRLFPLYYLVLAVYYILVFGLPSQAHLRESMVSALPYFLLYQQDILLCSYQAIGDWHMPFYQTWSLGVEEKFYLVWPVLAFVVWRVRHRTWWTVALLAFFASSGWLLNSTDPLMRTMGKCLFPHYHILVGCLLAQALHDRNWFHRLRFLAAGAWPVVTLILFLSVHLATPWVSRLPVASRLLDLAYPVALAPVLVGLVVGQGALPRLLGWAPLVFVGRLSYGIYLVHTLALTFVHMLLPVANRYVIWNLVAFLLVITLSILAAWVLAWTVERPAIQLGRAWSRRLSEGPTLGAVTPQAA